MEEYEGKILRPSKVKTIIFSKILSDFLVRSETTKTEQKIIRLILSSIANKQSIFIRSNSSFAFKEQIIPNIDECLKYWSVNGFLIFSIPLNLLNERTRIRREDLLKATTKMSGGSWFTVCKDNNLGYARMAFLQDASISRRHLEFKIDLIVSKYLFCLSQYFPISEELVFQSSSANALKFALWLSKYKRNGGTKKSYDELLSELSISKNKYQSRSIFERDLLIPVKADLDDLSVFSFMYYYTDKVYNFTIKQSDFIRYNDGKYEGIAKIKIKRALKNQKAKRKLKEDDLIKLKRYYDGKGYESCSKFLNRKIPSNHFGLHYIEAILKLH